MSDSVGYLPRKASALVLEALSDTRVVVVNGARQVGKSTLATTVLKQFAGSTTRYLDNPLTRTAAQEDPVRFVRHDHLMLIDEVQRVPELWLTIKELVDREPRPGRFLLTGSARLLGLRSLPDALPGRSETIELWPLSQGEIDNGPDGFVDAAFRTGTNLTELPESETASPTRKDYLARAARGGYPEAVRRATPRRRQRFFSSYVADIISRDVHQVADIQRTGEIRRLISLLAGQTSGLLNISRLASELGISTSTVRAYLAILETVFVIRIIPAYSANATKRTVGTPKITFVDSGLAAHLTAGITTDGMVGGLMENFVLGELGRQLTWSETDARLFHYRDRDQNEVDAILEDSSGQIIAIEVKAAETVRLDDFRALRILRDRLGDRFTAGFVLYCGPQQLSFGDRLACLPISALWTTPLSGTSDDPDLID